MPRIAVVIVSTGIVKKGEKDNDIHSGARDWGQTKTVFEHPRPVSNAMDALPLQPVLASDGLQ